MATKVRNTAKIFHAPALPNPPAEYNVQWQNQHNAVLRYYFANLDDAVGRALQFDTSDIIDGSIPNSKLENSTVSFGGVTVSLGGADATPAFNLSDATGYPAGSLTGEIVTAQIADDAVTDAKLADSINSAIAANTAKVTNATHTGEVTGATALTITDGAVVTARIADDAVTNAKLADDSVGTSQLGDLAVTTAKIADDAITTDKIAASAVSFGQLNTSSVTSAAIQPGAVNAGKITGPVSSRHSLFRNVASSSITTTAATTFYSFSIPAPESGTATQGFNMVVNVRFQNTSASAKNNHQFRITPQLKSKTNVGTSIGTATYVSSPSSYNAWYYVSGDVTDILSSGYGGFAPNSTASGMSYGDASMVEHYYSGSTNRTYFRISLFPNATTVLAGVEAFFSKSGFTSSGTWVNPNNFYNDRQHFPASSTQSIRYPMVRSVGREATATDLRLQFDHATSTTSLGTYIELIEGYCENIV